MAFWNTPIERASAPISSLRSLNGMEIAAVASRDSRSVTLGDFGNRLGDAACDDCHADKRQHHGDACERGQQHSRMVNALVDLRVDAGCAVSV